ncbi:hypothetical protein EDD22DRAFT_960004 [Suillus occidentalis]|nr:hypothetical protein EDD22DRAFT_960004 [Suillus occidentalis]
MHHASLSSSTKASHVSSPCAFHPIYHVHMSYHFHTFCISLSTHRPLCSTALEYPSHSEDSLHSVAVLGSSYISHSGLTVFVFPSVFSPQFRFLFFTKTTKGGGGGTYLLVLLETSNHSDANTGSIVDNSVNMDFSIPGLVAQPQPSPNITRDDLPPIPPTPPTQATPLNIIQSIKALGNKFDTLFQTLSKHIDIVESQVNSMEER